MSHPQQYTQYQHKHKHTRASDFSTFDRCIESSIMNEMNERRDRIVREIVSINWNALVCCTLRVRYDSRDCVEGSTHQPLIIQSISAIINKYVVFWLVLEMFGVRACMHCMLLTQHVCTDVHHMCPLPFSLRSLVKIIRIYYYIDNRSLLYQWNNEVKSAHQVQPTNQCRQTCDRPNKPNNYHHQFLFSMRIRQFGNKSVLIKK